MDPNSAWGQRNLEEAKVLATSQREEFGRFCSLANFWGRRVSYVFAAGQAQLTAII